MFRLNTSGEETVLHEFSGGTDGANPQGRLVMDKAGNFYGTTNTGGVSNAGTVFKVTRKGVETVLYGFTGKPDGANPVAGLAIDKAGNLRHYDRGQRQRQRNSFQAGPDRNGRQWSGTGRY